jgi:cellulase/cellobiase CelA1
MVRRLLLAVVTAMLPIAAILALGAANAATATAACSGDIAIEQFAFNPASVPAGQTSTLSLVAQNCTNQTLQGMVTRFTEFTGPGTGLPQGCPEVDPIALPFTLAPGASYTNSQQQGDTISGCEATGMTATVEFSVNNVGTVAQATANLVVVQPTPPTACHVTYTPNVWQGGFTASVTIANTGTTTFNGWTLAFTFPGDEKISNAWNATVTQSGKSVSAVNMSYNSTIAPGSSQSFGFQGTWTSSAASPTAFSVNGVTCN